MNRRRSFDWNAELEALKARRATETPAVLSPEQAAAQRQAQRDARANTVFRTRFSGRRCI